MYQELVKEFFEYKDGFLYWKIKACSTVRIGDLAGNINIANGESRRHIKYGRKTYKASRLIFLYHYGYLPETVDHIDRNTTNDKIENLRAATRTQNSRNSTSAKNSSSKYLGVTWFKQSKKWKAHIRINKELKYLGLFLNEKDAAIAYNNAAKIHFGEFANLNIIMP